MYCSLTDLMDMYVCQIIVTHTVVLVTIILSRRIDRGISNGSVPVVRIVRAIWVMGRIVWTPVGLILQSDQGPLVQHPKSSM